MGVYRISHPTRLFSPLSSDKTKIPFLNNYQTTKNLDNIQLTLQRTHIAIYLTEINILHITLLTVKLRVSIHTILLTVLGVLSITLL